MAATWASRATNLAPLLGIPFGLGAIHHVLAIMLPDPADSSTATRHGVFVGINLLFAALFGMRAKYTVFPASALVAQQTYSHGSAFLQARARGVIDGESLAVLVFLPVVLVVAIALVQTRASSTSFWRGAER